MHYAVANSAPFNHCRSWKTHTVEEQLGSSTDGVRYIQEIRAGLGGKSLSAGPGGTGHQDDILRSPSCANGVDGQLHRLGPLRDGGQVVRLIHDTELHGRTTISALYGSSTP